MLDWLYTAISWVLARWALLWDAVFRDPEPGTGMSGLAWALSIVCLVITVRLVLFPLFVKQVKSQRAMQELQPEIQKLRKQYGSDRQGFSQAMMALQKERGVNPLAGCLPILPQIPVFLSLFHVLRRLAPDAQGLYSWGDQLTDEAARAPLFGAPISSSFFMSGAKEEAILSISSYTNIRLVAFVLMIAMGLTMYYTQRQIMRRSGPVEGQAAMVQKMMLYIIPLSLFFSGFIFPIGVLLYWFTNNLWSMGQQFFILRKLPPPGSPAALARADAEKPAVDPRTLAPRPGAKPVRTKPAQPAAPAADAPATAQPEAASGGAASGGAGSAGAAGAGADGRPEGSRGASARPRSGAGRGGAGPASRAKRRRR